MSSSSRRRPRGMVTDWIEMAMVQIMDNIVVRSKLLPLTVEARQ